MALANSVVNQSAKQSFNLRSSFTVVDASIDAAGMGWDLAAAASQTRKQSLVDAAKAELMAHMAKSS